MKTGNVFWGVLLVALGALFLLDTLNIASICLGDLWKYWPLLLVLWGIGALVKNTKARWVVAALVAILLSLILYSFFSFRWVESSSEERDSNVQSQLLSEPYEPGITNATLEISAGAAKVIVEGSTDKLIEADTRSSFGKCTLSAWGEGDTRNIELKIPGHGGPFHFGRIRNEATIRLNETPSWEVSLGVGATSAELDLRSFAVKRLVVDAGATSLKLSLGLPKEETDVEIDAGASSITIEVPQAAPCAISIDAPLSSKDFDGFHKVESGRYETENFEAGPGAIHIKIDAGVSSIRVTRL
jgi:hypothetical protein